MKTFSERKPMQSPQKLKYTIFVRIPNWLNQKPLQKVRRSCLWGSCLRRLNEAGIIWIKLIAGEVFIFEGFHDSVKTAIFGARHCRACSGFSQSPPCSENTITYNISHKASPTRLFLRCQRLHRYSQLLHSYSTQFVSPTNKKIFYDSMLFGCSLKLLQRSGCRGAVMEVLLCLYVM